MTSRLAGLYAITDSSLLAGEKLNQGVAAAIAGGARLIQYRDKGSDQPRRINEAKQLLKLCRKHGVPLIINDDVALAAAIHADGVHLGRDDPDIESARRLLPTGIIGVSCYNEWHRARAACAAGADYIALGAFFASATKPDAVRADTTLIKRVKQDLNIAVVAIGGITATNGASLIEAGADMLAVVQGVFARPDIRQAARAYAQLFNNQINKQIKEAR